MPDLAGELAFAPEPFLQLRVGQCLLGQQFDRDLAVVAGVVGEPHLAHPAAPDQLGQLVRTNNVGHRSPRRHHRFLERGNRTCATARADRSRCFGSNSSPPGK
jgi:hypothetical protein